MMNSRQRVLTAIEHRQPDRVPITFDATPEVIESLERHFGVTTRDGVWDALNADTRLIGADHHDARIRTEGEISFDFWGCGRKSQAYSGGAYWEYVVFPLENAQTADEVEAYPWPSVEELSFDAIRQSKAANPDKAMIAHICHGGFFTATKLRKLDRLLMDFAERPEMAAAVMGKVNEYLYAAIERLCREAGDAFDIFYVADDFCSSRGPLISPDMFREYLLPYLKRYAEIVHGHGKKLLLHTCGSIRRLLPDLIEAGVDVMEPTQTSAEGMQAEGLKADFGRRITFYGGIDLIRVLSQGTPEEVRAEVLEIFRLLGRGGGYILGPGHTYIQPDVPLANILAMYETAFHECNY